MADGGEGAAFAPSVVQETALVAFLCVAAAWAAASAVEYLPSSGSAALKSTRATLGQWTVVGALLTIAAVAEFAGVVEHGGKTYVRDEFLFVLFLFAGVSIAFSTRDSPSVLRGKERERNSGGGEGSAVLIMSREQTEEWKGWMQFAFLLYHYYRAGEWYNTIRVLVSSYAFLTGYGNYLYFASHADFTFRRLLFMLWRLNFLTLLLMAAMDQPYILYYIVPLHTFYFLLTYVIMASFSSWNKNPPLLSVKLAMAFLAVWCLWDGPLSPHFEAIFAPLAPLLSSGGSLHEWHFRTFLDHYSTLFGIAFAVHSPRLAEWLKRAEALSRWRRVVAKGSLAVLVLVPALTWAHYVLLPLDKFSYNALHPYFVAVPITAYLVLRNLTPTLRSHHVELFRRFGTTTLETYVMQYHLFLADSAKGLLLLLPGYRLTNLLVTFSLLCAVAYVLFLATMALRDPMCNHSSVTELFERWLWILAAVLGCTALVALLPFTIAAAVAVPLGLVAAAFLYHATRIPPPPLGDAGKAREL